jgi:Fe-S cluster biosynthesis and repair protein YggX
VRLKTESENVPDFQEYRGGEGKKITNKLKNQRKEEETEKQEIINKKK